MTQLTGPTEYQNKYIYIHVWLSTQSNTPHLGEFSCFDRNPSIPVVHMGSFFFFFIFLFFLLSLS